MSWSWNLSSLHPCYNITCFLCFTSLLQLLEISDKFTKTYFLTYIHKDLPLGTHQGLWLLSVVPLPSNRSHLLWLVPQQMHSITCDWTAMQWVILADSWVQLNVISWHLVQVRILGVTKGILPLYHKQSLKLCLDKIFWRTETMESFLRYFALMSCMMLQWHTCT